MFAVGLVIGQLERPLTVEGVMSELFANNQLVTMTEKKQVLAYYGRVRVAE